MHASNLARTAFFFLLDGPTGEICQQAARYCRYHMMRCPETPGDPSHGLEVGEVEDLRRFSNQMATVEHMYRNTMGVVCTPTTPPRIPILLRSTVKDGGGDDMHVAIAMHVCAAPF